MPFNGFPRDTLHTPTPDPLLGSLLEEIHDLAELKATLRGLWLLHRKRQGTRAVALDEFLADPTLLRGIRPGPESANPGPESANPGPESANPADKSADPSDEIRRALRQAVRRGVFLAHQTAPGQVYFALNNDAGRRAIAQLKHAPAPPDQPGPLTPQEAPPRERLNIFALYEDTIGLLTPILTERLQEAEQRYPPGWIREAFEIAALENKRSWGYIDAILKRWGSEGKSGRQGGNHDHGKPGGNTPQDQRRKYREDYERRRGAYQPPVGNGG